MESEEAQASLLADEFSLELAFAFSDGNDGTAHDHGHGHRASRADHPDVGSSSVAHNPDTTAHGGHYAFDGSSLATGAAGRPLGASVLPYNGIRDGGGCGGGCGGGGGGGGGGTNEHSAATKGAGRGSFAPLHADARGQGAGQQSMSRQPHPALGSPIIDCALPHSYHDLLRTPRPGHQMLVPTASVNLSYAALGVSRSLTRPMLASRRDLLVTGTDQALTREARTNRNENGSLVIAAKPFSKDAEYSVLPIGDTLIRGLAWLKDGETIMLAHNHGFGMLSLNQEDLANSEVQLYDVRNKIGAPAASSQIPPGGMLRELAPHPTNSETRVASGGFDCQVHVWDPSRLFSQGHEPGNAREISGDVQRIDCQGIVSSISWAPFSEQVLCWTQDQGNLCTYDLRAGRMVAEVEFQSTHGGRFAFAHAFSDLHSILVGFGDATTNVVDARRWKALWGWDEPSLDIIGDIQVHRARGLVAASGVGGVSLRTFASPGTSATCITEHLGSLAAPQFSAGTEPQPWYAKKVACTFFPDDSGALAAVDSSGTAHLLSGRT